MTSRTEGTSEASTTPVAIALKSDQESTNGERQVDVQVAQAEDVGQLLGEDPAQEEEARQVVVALAQDPLLEAGCAGVQLVPAVVDLLAADHDEEHVRPLAGRSGRRPS